VKPSDEVLQAQQKLDEQRRDCGIQPPPKKPRKPKGSFDAEKQQGARNYVNRVVAVAESTDEIANGRTDTEWILVAKSLCDCPLPYRPTEQTKITKRTRFNGKWVKVTYSAVRDGIAMPYGTDTRFMHWLIDRAVQEGRKTVKLGQEPSRSVTWNSTYEYLKDLGASRSDRNYKRSRESFKRLSGLAITIEIESASDEEGQILPFLESWKLPKSISHKERSGQLALDIDRYGFTISDPLFKQAMKYLVTIPRRMWRLTKGNPRKGALLLWAFTRAYASTGESRITWDVLREQFWYDESNPWKIKGVMHQIAVLLKALWAGANMTITDEGVVFDKATSAFLPDDPNRGRVRRNK
jgi:Replication initiator protein A